MPRRVQNLGEFEQQFTECIRNSIDKRFFLETTTPGANVEFSLEHGLGYVPLGFLVISKDRAADVYLSATAATTALIYLKCTVASAVLRVMVF